MTPSEQIREAVRAVEEMDKNAALDGAASRLPAFAKALERAEATLSYLAVRPEAAEALRDIAALLSQAQEGK